MADLVVEHVDVEPDDAVLVKGVLDGDRAAFAALYRRHVTAVSRAVARRVHNADAVGDTVQEVFVRALERLEELRDPSRFLPWIVAIARNAATDRRRLSGRIELRDNAGTDVVDGGPGPDEHAELAELASLVRGSVLGLSSRDAQALSMVIHLGLTPGDIAGVFGITTNAAKVLLHRARRRLRDALVMELLVRRRGGGCDTLRALLDSDPVAAGAHARACDACVESAQSEVSLYAARPHVAFAAAC